MKFIWIWSHEICIENLFESYIILSLSFGLDLLYFTHEEIKSGKFNDFLKVTQRPDLQVARNLNAEPSAFSIIPHSFNTF